MVSQISPGRRNRLWFSLDGADQSLSFDQELPETLWVGSRSHAAVVPRGVAERRTGSALLTPLPPGHPQGYQDCFNALVGDVYQAVAAEVPEEMPSFADGVRAARITQAVLDSVAGDCWVAVGDAG